ncbi:hypothetical protein PRIPAC_85529 [Pristionchus pacificus]|uniref:MARVEL domain-containing protein n=1 Tax=Pristionchus pacificus TaxID=54126 RepID=A0A2A6CIF0_PRIPA|nr:hypothetical protein PRIPAC_85529 [Pristionchus pacificus]|eukprot:PDM77982.1 hypothetical protein PRIPAC_35171 [Pristionchus pacificus]
MAVDTYTTKAPDGTYLTTTTKTHTKYEEDMVYRIGRGPFNRKNLMSMQGILRIMEIIAGLMIISLVVSVFGPGPFKGALFGQTILLIFAGVSLCLSFIFLVVYIFNLHDTHLDFWPWRVTDMVFCAVASIFYFVLSFVEGYYSTGSWANNCNDIGSDGIMHNGCRFVYEWAFAAILCFFCGFMYAVSAFIANRTRP